MFSKNKIVSDERKTQILKDCKENNNQFICHKGTIKNIDVVCKGFYDKYNNKRINKILEKAGLIEFVNV